MNRNKRKQNQDELMRFRTFWRRFWAGQVDGIVLMPLFYLNMFIWNHAKDVPTSMLLSWYIFMQLSTYIYSIFLHARFGQTLGKMLFHVKVVDLSERPITISQAILRDIIPIILMLIIAAQDVFRILQGENLLKPTNVQLGMGMMIILFFTGVGWFLAELVTMLTNKKRRALHDFIAGTVVITVPRS